MQDAPMNEFIFKTLWELEISAQAPQDAMTNQVLWLALMVLDDPLRQIWGRPETKDDLHDAFWSVGNHPFFEDFMLDLEEPPCEKGSLSTQP